MDPKSSPDGALSPSQGSEKTKFPSSRKTTIVVLSYQQRRIKIFVRRTSYFFRHFLGLQKIFEEPFIFASP